MKMNPIPVAAVIILLVLVPLLGQAEEELFDTKAATQHIEQGISYLKAKNFDAAITEFENAADINPDAEAYYYLGYTYYLKGRTGDEESRKKSRENFERAYEIDPNFSPSRFKPTEEVPAPMEQPDQIAPPVSEATPTPPSPTQEQEQQQPASTDQAK
jgi:tetratricopeptide (TPR) repeat protein